MSEKPLSMHQIVAEMKTLKEVAARDPINYGPTGPAIAVAARQASERIEVLKGLYGALVKKGAVAIFMTGPASSSEFASVSQEEFGTINADASELYRRIGGQISPGMGSNREFNSQQAGQMIAALREIGGELDWQSMPAPTHDTLPVVLKTEADVTEYVRGVVRKAMGDTLNIAYLERKILAQALDAEHVNPAVPVLVIGAKDDEIAGLSQMFERPTETITVTGEVTKEAVTKHFTAVKNKLRTKK